MEVVTTFGERLTERRLARATATMRQLREELRIVDEQLEAMVDEASDKELRSLVSETPIASFEHRDALGHVNALSQHRIHVVSEIAALNARQDSLLDKLAR